MVGSHQSEERTSFCGFSFISKVNGYRYCGDPQVKASTGYNPYCPSNPGSAFKCPLSL